MIRAIVANNPNHAKMVADLPADVLRVNFHWHAQPWPNNASAKYVRQAFSNAADPDEHDGPFCHDLEPPETHVKFGAEYQAAMNHHVSARQRTRTVFPNRQLWAYDVAAGYATPMESTARTCAARQALDGYDAAGQGIYATWAQRGPVFQAPQRQFQLEGYRRCSELCWPQFKVIAFVSNAIHGAPAGVECPMDLFNQQIKLAQSHADICCLWFAEAGTRDIKPYLKALLEA